MLARKRFFFVLLFLAFLGGSLADLALASWRGKTLRIPLAPATAGPLIPAVEGPAGRPLIVIDPGHGGHDPGAISPFGGLMEKTLTLDAARKIRAALLASGRVRVALTRDADRFLALRERTAIARHLKADLFLSVHADSADRTALGASIYTLSDIASDREAQALAQRENKADILNGINLSGRDTAVTSILVDLAQRETMARSVDFARLLRREGSGLVPFHAGGVRMAGLAVLKAPDMPAVLLELGYLSHPADVERLRSSAGQAAIARMVRRAVDIHFAVERGRD
ncbi:MAG: N-acetylmuramoyl-L-alanine amidase [Chakrabartia sp.]